jgi:hypothetical protein
MLLEEYGLIGDLESAALVGRNGSIAFSHLTLIPAARAISTAGAKVEQAAA